MPWIGLIELAKMLGTFMVMLFAACVFGIWILLFSDFDPPFNEPPCKAGSIVTWLDPCEVK